MNRCLTEGRRSLSMRLAGIQGGIECAKLAPLLSAPGLPQHGLEDGLQLERRAPDDLEHAVGRRLPLDCFGQIALQLLDAPGPTWLTRSHGEILAGAAGHPSAPSSR